MKKTSFDEDIAWQIDKLMNELDPEHRANWTSTRSIIEDLCQKLQTCDYWSQMDRKMALTMRRMLETWAGSKHAKNNQL